MTNNKPKVTEFSKMSDVMLLRRKYFLLKRMRIYKQNGKFFISRGRLYQGSKKMCIWDSKQHRSQCSVNIERINILFNYMHQYLDLIEEEERRQQ